METLVQLPLGGLLFGTWVFGAVCGFVIGGILMASAASEPREGYQPSGGAEAPSNPPDLSTSVQTPR